jgi:hypothetical protein
MRTQLFRIGVPALLVATAAGCQDQASEPARSAGLAIDDVTVPPKGISLVMLTEGADLAKFVQTVEQLDGAVFHILEPRMVVARLPEGADEVLTGRGMAEHFERAVMDTDLDGPSVAERRFARVFSNRFYPDAVGPDRAIARRYAPVPPGEPFETAVQTAPATGGKLAAAGQRAATVQEAESWVYVPYASGTIVVSVWLPESNGVGEPSTEDWTEDDIVAVQDKVQNALEAVKRHNPNSNLRFVLHYESSPAPGGLEGTIDHDWEFGKQANWAVENNEWRSYGAILSRLLGHDVADDVWNGLHEYLNGLRDRYQADGAFIVAVAANANNTAGLRAHAFLNGPVATLHSGNSWNVFLHEFGHIFGALDEYCPDACVPPFTTAGYLGVINANATYRPGEPGGINDGQGEDQPSLMAYNIENAVNGYTRGAWGWLDTDGDGIIEVRDTVPHTDVGVRVESGELRVQGEITDVPARPLAGTPFSVNRIRALQYRFADIVGCPWFEVPLDGRTRGRQQVDLGLGAISGAHVIEVRSVNSVGNVEKAPRSFAVQGPAQNTAPFVALEVSPHAGSTSSTFALDARAVDLEGDAVTLRFDTDGDGVFDTAASPSGSMSLRISSPGIHVVRVEARDALGLARIAEREILVLDNNAAPEVTLSAPSNPTNGSDHAEADFTASGLRDPDGDAVELNWIQETVGAWGELNRVETGFGAPPVFHASLPTPSELNPHRVDLLNGNPRPVRDTLALGNDRVALALGSDGIAIVDVSDRKAPVVLSRLGLETSAYSLARQGNLLYVLGGQVAVVNIANPSAPLELKQQWTERGTVAASADEAMEIPPGGWATQYIDVSDDAKMSQVKVVVDIDHEDARMLSINLATDKDIGAGEVQLLAEGAAPKNRKHFVFTPANTPALKAFEGKFSRGTWLVQVQEHRALPDGEKAPCLGRLVRSEVQVRTAHRAIPVHKGAHEIVGVVAGRYPVIAGRGIEVLDCTFPRMATQAARVEGDWVADAVLRGNTLIAGSYADTKDVDAATASGWGWGGYARGMYAIDLTWPWWPRIVRTDDSVHVRELASIGSRLYVWASHDGEKGGDYCVVGDPAAFTNGGDWVLGESDLLVRRDAVGDDQRITSLDPAGNVQELDVTNPAGIALLRRFLRPWAERMTALSGGDLLLSQWADHTVVNLNDTRSITSRVFRISVEARDARGAIRTVSRDVHVVPYAHPPMITGVETVRGHDVEDEWEFVVHVDDPDQRPTWDPVVLASVDLDGDGVADSSWGYDFDGSGAHVTARFPAPGSYLLRFIARDGFWGLSPAATLGVEVGEHVAVACGGDFGNTCQAGQFCMVDGADACGGFGVGFCATLGQPCDKPEEPTWVCGCDHVDYPTACHAHSAGVNVASEGPCPVVSCMSQAQCESDQFCFFEADAGDPANGCGALGPGTCKPRPDICHDRVGPGFSYVGVCGCDGITYRDECAANLAGVSVSKYEPCEPPPPDCTVTGCDAGSVCKMCWGRMICMPAGAMC